MVQFGCPLFFATEDERHMSIDVVRLGTHHGRSRVTFRTEDASAKDGQHYHGAKGEVVFESGENMKQIQIKMISSDMWIATNSQIIC